MSISSTLDQVHALAKRNNWLWLFSIFNRLVLALGFIPAAIVKLMDERFASGLHVNHPMGHYLEAVHLTGYYYTFIGVAQLLAAIFLLIPRTATLGAFIYFPIILNITVLTFATRFDGSMFTAPLMTLANLYILGWNYEKWRYILPFNRSSNEFDITEQQILESGNQLHESKTERGGISRYVINPIYARLRHFLRRLRNDKFPIIFFAAVIAAVFFFMVIVPDVLYRIKPRNTLPQCLRQFKDTSRTQAGENFCSCIHINGEPLNKCLNEYNNASEDVGGTPQK